MAGAGSTFRSPFELSHTYAGVPFSRAPAKDRTLLSCLRRRALAQPDEPFLTTVARDGTAEGLTYGEAELLSRLMAGWLGRTLELDPGDVVGMAPANDLASIVAILGLLASGCAILLLNPAEPLGRLRSQVAARGARVVLRGPAVDRDDLGSPVLPLAALRRLEEQLGPGSGPEPAPQADAFLIPTSGSTAVAKVVAQSHRNAVANAEAVGRHHELRPGDRLLGCLPIHHVNGLHFTLLATLAAGAHAVVADGFDPFTYPLLIERFRPRLASVVPSIMETLVATWRRPYLPPTFRYFVSAAAPLPARTARLVGQKLKTRVLQGYGLTETTNFSTTMPARLSASAYRRLILEADIPSVGTALHGNEVALLTAQGAPVEPGNVGEVCMRGHNVMMRYAGNPEATAEAFRDGWFHSQDLGFEVDDRDSGNRFLVLTGRIKNIAKVRGQAVSLDEMDRALRSLPQVRDAACVALPHRLLGDQVVAAIVASEPIAAAQVRARLLETFAASVLPQRIVWLDAIPRSPTGKVLRPQLADRLSGELGAVTER